MKRRNMIKTAAALASPLLIHPAFGVLHSSGPVQQRNLSRFGDSRDWFFEKRYGLFIHWGLYSIPAWHEQYQWRAKVPRAEYVKLAEKWNPARFNPDRWLDIMEEAGMKYITITTKHHDGFCLWDTKQTRFSTMNTPYRKDIIGMLADACHRRKVPLCLYYSIADWNHPAYPNQGRHHELAGPGPGDTPDWDRYMEFLTEQVRELCSNYGEIHGFWWDMNVPQHKDPSINAMIRKLQPTAVINNRGFDEGDFGTPERDFDTASAESATLDRPAEACQSVGMESWGYREDEDYYSTLHLERSIDRYLARDANYLLNVGPDAEGLFPSTSLRMLRELGTWYKSVEESYNAIPAPKLLESRDVMVTCRDNIVYLHFNRGLAGNGFKLKPLVALPEKATILNNGKAAEYSASLLPSEHISGRKYLRLKNLPVNEMSDSVIVVKLQFKNSVNLQENV